MNVVLSISSSRRRLPSRPLWIILIRAWFFFAVFAATMEGLLYYKGYHPTVQDNEMLWTRERVRADELGSRALVIVGASRIQLALDISEIRRHTPFEPVQLAIDGSNFVKVLRDLAEDQAFHGSVIVDFYDHALFDYTRSDLADIYLDRFHRSLSSAHLPTYRDSEDWLTYEVRGHLRSYGDGARPLSILTLRILRHDATPQYLITLPDRSRLADYTKVPMPFFYLGRVMRSLDITTIRSRGPLDYAALETLLRDRIAALTPLMTEHPQYVAGAQLLRRYAETIKQRGGRIYFVMLPKSGMIKEIEDRRYPRDSFWNVFVKIVQAPSLHFEDVPEMRALHCPDGSHLDFRDRTRFTDTLITALNLGPS